MLPTISLLITLPFAFTCTHTHTHTHRQHTSHEPQTAAGRLVTHQHVNGLDHVDEDLVLLVPDALGSPGHGVGDGGGHFGLGHLQLVPLLRDVPERETQVRRRAWA